MLHTSSMADRFPQEVYLCHGSEGMGKRKGQNVLLLKNKVILLLSGCNHSLHTYSEVDQLSVISGCNT